MITISKAKEEDLDIIKDIAYATWPHAYLDMVGQEQIDYMLEKMYNKGELLDQLLQGYVFLIAQDGAKQYGFAAYSVTDRELGIYKLHKLYVVPAEHGKGIGKLLINEVHHQVKEQGAKALELNVNKKNGAKAFYLKAGFTVKESVVIDIGHGFAMDDYVMEYLF